MKECEPQLEAKIKSVSTFIKKVSFLKRSEDTFGRDYIRGTRTIGEKVGDFLRPFPVKAVKNKKRQTSKEVSINAWGNA